MHLKHILALGLTAAVIFPAAHGLSVSADTIQADTQQQTEISTLAQNEPTVRETFDNITWEFYNDTGELKIEGSGSTPACWPWFNYKDQIKTVTIGKNITSIGDRGFLNHPNLTKVTITGSSNIDIGDSAFENCPKLSSITFSGSVGTIGQQAFNKCTSLQKIIFPGSVSKIGKSAFEGCFKLSSIQISKGATSIGEQAFLNCTNLSTVNIANGASNIGEFAFKNCTALPAISISDSTTTIGKGAFLGCAALKTITLPKNLTAINESTFDGCTHLSNITIPSKINTIDKQAFLNCESLTKIELPSSVKSIGESAFTGCTGLSMVTIPKETTRAASNIFNGCTALTDIRYTGTASQWKNLKITLPQITTAQVLQKIYYNYTPNHKHSYITYKIGKETVFICKLCGDHQKKKPKTQTPTPAPKPAQETVHKWSGWTTISSATVFKGAVQKRTCSICKKSETRTGSKLKPTMKVNITSFPLKIKQKTTILKVSGFAKGDSVASWKSSNTKIVTVSETTSGSSKITAGKKTGKATITIILKSGLKKNISVTVQKKAVAAKKITGVPKTLKLKVKKKASLKPVLTPVTCIEKITYKTSNKKIATVNKKGQITAKKKGKAVITVKAGKKTVKCKVTVK